MECIGVCGCREEGLDGYEGVVIGASIAGCSICCSNGVVVVFSSECSISGRSVVVHSGWARGAKGLHILYGLEANGVDDIASVFYRETGCSSGFIVNTLVRDKYVSALITSRETRDFYIHDKPLWIGVIAGYIACLYGKGYPLDKIFYNLIERFIPAIEHNDPLYSFRVNESILDAIMEHMKYLPRLVRIHRIWRYTGKVIACSPTLDTNRAVYTEIHYNPVSPVVNGPIIVSSRWSSIAGYVVRDRHAVICLESVPREVLEEIQKKGLVVGRLDTLVVIQGARLRDIVFVFEKILLHNNS